MIWAFSPFRKVIFRAQTFRSMSESLEIKTFVFLDTETTGLPSEENNRTKITELSMVAVQASHIRLGVFPRVQNKLNFCFNPRKLISSSSEEITGLSNHLLEPLPSFSAETVASINSFLNHNPQPICFVAHNGNNFDYPLMRAEIDKTKSTLREGILCVDSLVAFRDIHLQETETDKEDCEKECIPLEFTDEYDQLLFEAAEKLEGLARALEAQRRNETTPRKRSTQDIPHCSRTKKMKFEGASKKLNFGISFKLCDMYTRLTGRSPENLHHAEGDALMLITCAATLGDKFVDWANSHARQFCDVPIMVSGKKIGT